MTHQSARRVDSCIASVDAVEPLRLAELKETLLRHVAVGCRDPAPKGGALQIAECWDSLALSTRASLAMEFRKAYQKSC